MGRRNKSFEVEENTIVVNDVEQFSKHLKAVTQNLQPKQDRIQLKKAKIKDGLFLEVEYSETIADGTNTVKKDCTAPVHDDLKNAFSKLDGHLQDLCEQNDECTCKGFSIGGSGDHEGVVLIGSRDIKLGTLNLVSPFAKWDCDYEEISDLSEAIEGCKHEVKLYLFEGKHKPEAQQELPFDESTTSTEEE
jgi:hypothetical protein